MSPHFRPNNSFLTSFQNAFRGIGIAFNTQRNLKIHLVLAGIVMIASVYFQLSKIEWMLVSLSIVLVLFAEMFNSALEFTVDLATRKRRYRAMFAKDIAAGAVLLTSIHAIIVGYMVFFDRVTQLFL